MLMKMMIAGMLTEDSSGSHLRVIDNAEKTTKQVAECGAQKWEQTGV